MAVASAAAHAADGSKVYEINVAPGPLKEAIDRLARTAHLQVLYDPELVRGRSTRGVTGALTTEQALARLLESTDVAWRFTADDAVALYRQTQRANVPGKTARSTQPQPAGALPTQTVTVSSTRLNYGKYTANATISATKVDGPSLATPISYESITQQILRDQQVNHLEDAIEGISSVEVAPDGQSALGFIIRGFPTYQYYVDGVRVSPDLHHDGFLDLANVERIDVVKGPASTLYGRTEPGGLINIITKKPTDEPYLAIEQRAGSYNRWRTQLDAGGPVSMDGSVLYRFNAAYESGNSFREGLGNHRVFVAPVVTWRASPRAELSGYLEYLHSYDPTDAGLPVVGSSLPPVPVRRRVEDGGDIPTTGLRVGVRGLYALAEGWTLRYTLDGRWLDTPQLPQLALADDGLDPSQCSRASCPVDQVLMAVPVSSGHTYYSSAEAFGSVNFWRTKHAVLFGAEAFNVTGHTQVVYSDTDFTTDLFSPRHGPVPASLLTHPDWSYATSTVESWTSVYLQDHIELGPRVYVLLGARYDHVKEWLDVSAGIPLADAGSDQRWDHSFKRRAGLTWRATPQLSLYANYMEDFGISMGLYGDGGGGTGILVPPEWAHQWEIGIKAELLEGRASGSLAWFDLIQVNMSTPVFDPYEGAQGFRNVTGEARSRGLELNLQGEILPHVHVLASYAYLDSRITDDAGLTVDDNGNLVSTLGNTGNRLYGAPRHGGSFWATWRPEGSLKGLKLGLGAIARGWREGDNENDYQIPGYAKWKILAGYGWHVGDTRLNVQLNVDNLFNARYFESISGTHTVMPGMPRSWQIGVRAEF